ncbi:hypothetical protein PDESU_04199 [Pontiella desulfatans]|uniref:Uncharacterized protein n=1 Tax=Pontiella desulfatans TaxID=2750659 RepID=A0A6C2U866_PONDE|nr:hypothetical protein [Pontiella desulfatans]VGO15614.1 hypothetical protein PDESU_04199 [Pontiella desulfatans]
MNTRYFSIAFSIIVATVLAQTSVADGAGISEQIAKLKVAAPTQEMVADLNLDPFYTKALDLGGFTIVGNDKVDDHAFRETAYIVKQMLQNRPDAIQKLAENHVRFVLIDYTEFVTQMPEYSDMKPAKFWDRRARGLGPNHQRPAVSCGEENVLRYPGDPYHQESILVHEFAHAIMDMALVDLDPEFKPRLVAAYDDAMAKGLWKDKYAANNVHEYWAEGVQSFFDDNREPDHDHNHVNTREELTEYDPVLADIIMEQLGDIDWKYAKPAARAASENIHLAGYDPATAPTFAWPQELLDWYANYQEEQKAKKKEEG